MSKSYIYAPNKRAVQQIALRSGHKKLIGLGGPNIIEYLQVVKQLGYKEVIVFENNAKVYQEQVFAKPDCTLRYEDIIQNLRFKAFYDLDFCCTIRTIEDFLPIITKLENYALTLSLRGIGISTTVSTFRKYSEAFYIKYVDTSPMITFFNNPKN